MYKRPGALSSFLDKTQSEPTNLFKLNYPGRVPSEQEPTLRSAEGILV